MSMDGDVYLKLARENLQRGRLKTQTQILRSTTAIVRSLGRAVQWQRAIAKLDELKALQVLPDQVLFSSVIAACRNAGIWKWAVSLFDTLDGQVRVDVVTCATVIGAFDRAVGGQRWQEALCLFREFSGRRIEANNVAYNAVANCFKEHGGWSSALRFIQELGERSLRADLVSHNTALSTFEEASAWQQALSAFAFLQLGQEQVDLITCSTAISIFAKAGEWQLALLLFCELVQSPDVIAFNSVISACVGGGQWQTALFLLEELDRRELRPNLITYNAVSSVLDAGGAWQVADRMLGNLAEQAFQADLLTFNSLLGAHEGEWRRASMLLHSLEAEGLQAALL